MNLKRTFLTAFACSAVVTLSVAQSPVATVDPQRHGNLAAAQSSIIQAYSRIEDAQHENGSHLDGHAQKAKNFLDQANDEIRAAAVVADQNEQGSNAAAPTNPTEPSAPSAPPDLTGNWTIYASNVNQPGSSLKQVQLFQSGNIVSGTFRGPHQHGKLQGWISGNHVEFSTDTNDVLTFRGEITATGMSGLYGIHGQHAPWNAQRN
jgi:hypothetical protein